MADKKPNIILINADDLGYGDLSCYGSEVNRTPYIDSMAKNGLRFTDFYMAAPVCSPSRGAMMTGCYPARISFGTYEGKGVLFPGQGVGLNPKEISIAKLLKTSGYRTMIIGKWHCGDQKEFLPLNHGFDKYYGLPYSNDMGRTHRMQKYPPLPLMMNNEVIEQQPDQATITERYTEQAVRFIRENKQDHFFLYMAHMAVHLPHYAPERFLRQSRNGRFGAALECMDWSAGVIANEVKKLGLADNTLIIFTSDNGARITEGGSCGKLRGAKGTTWEGGQRVPCVMYWPGVIKPGECKGLASSIDFYPTFARLAGAALPADRIIDGKDLQPLMNGEGVSNRQTFFYYAGDALCAVRNKNWKLHVGKGRIHANLFEKINELYDLENDIGETNNLYDSRPDIVKQLTPLIDQCRIDLGDAGTGVIGKNVRPIGKIENPKTLTIYNEEYPYYMAEYDLEDMG
ncbi:MAG: sulfatase [Treponema sp.]|nr:sulfatase [Treponema sp.]